MNRRYTFEKFFSLVKLIRKYSKNASITTDYIVGFPTETLKQFENSVKNLKTIKFSDMHIFPYSPRKDTAAEKLDDIVGSTERTKRFKIIDKLNITCRRKYLKSFVGEDVDVLFEKPKSSGLQVGHSNFFFKVQVNTNEDLTNRLFRIRIIDIKDDELVGNHFLMHEKNI
jgi:threonylcarbamoyladenosine tRNA methylthiotransferase MtaB